MEVFRSRGCAVLYILHSGNLYGTERMALATMEGLGGYDRRVLFAPPPAGAASVNVEARKAGQEAVVFTSRWSLLKALLPWFLRYARIDVIGTGVVHSWACHVLGRLLNVQVRQLHVAHGGTPDSFERKNALNRIPVRVIAVSDFVRQQLVRLGVRPGAITVIENFLSNAQRDGASQRAPYQGPAALAIDRERVRVAVVSRVDPIKKVHVLIDAVERHGLAQFQFDIYGVGEDLVRLKTRSAGLANVRFHDFVPDVKDRLAGADLLLHLCPEEPFGLVILEAFLARVLAIVPDAGGAGSLVQDGATGLRFAADDVDDLFRVLMKARDMDGRQLQDTVDAAVQALNGRFSQAEGVLRYQLAIESAGPAGRRD